MTGDLTEITDGEPTFLFRIPERSRLSLAPPVPRTPDGQVVDEDEDGYEDIEDEDDAVAGAEVQYDVDDDGDVPMDLVGGDTVNLPLREASVPLGDEAESHAQTATATKTKQPTKRLPRELKVSRHGIEYPSFPPAVVKRMANTFSRQYGGSGKLSKDTLSAIQQASDWFFEQVSEDLGDYATHAGRKTIEEADAITLMKRYVLLFPLFLFLRCSWWICRVHAVMMMVVGT
jgi:histone H3/H4